VVLEQGRVVERGNHQSLMAANGLYARLSLARERSPRMVDPLVELETVEAAS